MRKVFRHYPEVDMEKLIGYTITTVLVPEDRGFLIEAERDINGGTLGIDISYDPEEEAEVTISDEYIKHTSEECPIAKEIATQEMEALVRDLKIDYEVSVEVCGEDDDVNTLQSKELYEKAQTVLEFLKTGSLGRVL